MVALIYVVALVHMVSMADMVSVAYVVSTVALPVAHKIVKMYLTPVSYMIAVEFPFFVWVVSVVLVVF